LAQTHPDLAAEQAYIDRAYAALDAMRALAVERLQAALTQGRGTMQALMERDVVVENSLGRLEQLQIGDESLSFGRIDVRNGDGEPPERWYIGRLAVSGPDQEPLVVDWRAPIAEPFYRATGRHPMDLTRRRHFLTQGRRIAGIEDEVFGQGGEGDDDEIVGPGALLAALERSRTGSMRDIVATVQREQDEIIRAPLAGALVVQGGPGTGKTAVALHRAAYLLYTHRFPLERQGVLVVGPNPLFLRYIEHVLPSLGETGVVLTSVNGLVGLVKPKSDERPAVARLKGDPRMAKLVARAVKVRQRPLRHELVVPFGAATLRVPPAATAEMVASVKRRGGTHNARRRQLEKLLVRRLVQANAAAVDRSRRAGLRGELDENAAEVDQTDVAAEIRRQPAVREALDRMWPLLSPMELLHDLFGSPALLAAAGKGLLGPSECDLLHRPRSDSFDAIPWTPADLPLLDEAFVHLGPRTRKRVVDDGSRAFGHIVVDEAQDLTPMQLRVLGRRSMSGSMTIVGDVAQATGPWAPESWKDVLAHLPGTRHDRVVELTVNYRTPAEIMELAGRVLAEAAPDIPLPRSVRSTENRPELVAASTADLADAVAERAGQLASDPAPGTIAVIHPPSLGPALAAALDARGVRFGRPDEHGLDETVTLVPIGVVKGLEFDSVLVVEPAALVEESHQGMRALFVALTRATQRMVIFHAGPLPAPLT
jgi:DNA helicase IV